MSRSKQIMSNFLDDFLFVRHLVVAGIVSGGCRKLPGRCRGFVLRLCDCPDGDQGLPAAVYIHAFAEGF